MRARLLDGWSAAQVRAAERPLLDAGVPLMRRAAAGLAAELTVELGRADAADGPVVLLAGSGANGGDGLWAVSELADAGVEVLVVPTGSRRHEEGLAAALAAGAIVVDAVPARAALLVDAIVGTGTSGALGLRGRAHEVVAGLLAGPTRPRTVAVDIPSGIGVDDGGLPDDGVVLPADVTVTFGAVKAGLLLSPARELAGEVRLIDLGLGPHLEGVPLTSAAASRPAPRPGSA